MNFVRHICVLLAYLLLSVGLASAQNSHYVQVIATPEECTKGSASIKIFGGTHVDSVIINWSTGDSAVYSINNLDAAPYAVQVKYVHTDTIITRHDTLIPFQIEKKLCPLDVPRYFSPNGDGYNDFFTVSRIENYPYFELIIYNRSGQRVHHQEKEFMPWDGTWIGTGLPDGTYYYVIFYDKKNASSFMKGDVTILR